MLDAEGRAEGGQRQQRDGQRIGAEIVHHFRRYHRAERQAERHQDDMGHRLRQADRAAEDAVAATAIIAPEISPPGNSAQ